MSGHCVVWFFGVIQKPALLNRPIPRVGKRRLPGRVDVAVGFFGLRLALFLWFKVSGMNSRLAGSMSETIGDGPRGRSEDESMRLELVILSPDRVRRRASKTRENLTLLPIFQRYNMIIRYFILPIFLRFPSTCF